MNIKRQQIHNYQQPNLKKIKPKTKQTTNTGTES